jgi:kynurenine formamidase
MQYLSHVLDNNTPQYGNAGPWDLRRSRQIKAGDTSNNSELCLSAHFGTHIDAPLHFDPNGKALDEYSPEFFTFKEVIFLSLSVKEGQLIELADIMNNLETAPKKADLLLIKTGAENWRENDPDKYIFHGPGVHAEVGHYLRKNTDIRMIGFDFLSLTSYEHRDHGRIAHRAFLSLDENNDGLSEMEPILICEDMRLSVIEEAPNVVQMFPLRFQHSDGAPACVVAQ